MAMLEVKDLIDNPKLVHEISKFNHQYALEHFLASKVVDKFESDICKIVNAN